MPLTAMLGGAAAQWGSTPLGDLGFTRSMDQVIAPATVTA